LNLIEAHQYILAQFYREIGIGDNFNMKRERINTAETELMTGSLDVNVWNMLKNRQDAVEKINELFGTSISVRFNENVFTEEEEEDEEEPQTESEDIVEMEEEAPEEETSQEEEVREEKVVEKSEEGE
jgi:Phage Connector (GP10).